MPASTLQRRATIPTLRRNQEAQSNFPHGEFPVAVRGAKSPERRRIFASVHVTGAGCSAIDRVGECTASQGMRQCGALATLRQRLLGTPAVEEARHLPLGGHLMPLRNGGDGGAKPRGNNWSNPAQLWPTSVAHGPNLTDFGRPKFGRTQPELWQNSAKLRSNSDSIGRNRSEIGSTLAGLGPIRFNVGRNWHNIHRVRSTFG